MFKGIGKKITFAYVVVTITLLTAGIFIWSKIEGVLELSSRTARKVETTTHAAALVQNSIFDEVWSVERFHRGASDQAVQQFQTARREVDDAIQVLMDSNLLSPIESDSLSNFRHRFHALALRMFEISDSLRRVQEAGNVRSIGELTRAHQALMASLDVRHRQLDKMLLTLQLRASDLLAQSQRENSNAIDGIKLSLTLLAAFTILVTLAAWLMTERYVTRPLQRLTAEVRSMGAGDLQRRIHIGGDDEIKLLEQSFNQMMDDLQKNIQKRQEDEMELMREHKLAAIGQLAQGIAHNLNNPLGVIFLASEIMAKKNPASAEAEIIHGAARKMKTIIDTLLHKSRREQMEAKQEINLNDLISEELRFLEADLEFKHKIQKNIRLAENLPLIVGVYSDFSQSIMNLVRNAIDSMYRSSRKQLVIQTRFDEQNIYVDIADTGSGIPEEIIPKLFDPFFTTKPLKGTETGDEPTGTGLGLPSCRQLLQPYGANISVRSKVNEGSTFTITIPYNSNEQGTKQDRSG